MGKGKNIVECAKERASITLVLVIAAGWLLVAGNTLLNNDLIEQEALVQSAEKYRNEQLYVLAVQGYQEALSNYQTERNDEYEKSLLNLYQEAGMTEEYYSLIESRAEQGRAEAEEYLSRAKALIESGAIRNALSFLQDGIERTENQELIDLRESVLYAYTLSAIDYEKIQLPSEDWMIPVFDGKLWGYIGPDGKKCLDFIYEDASPFSNGYAVVKTEGNYTAIDEEGYWYAVDPNQLDSVEAFLGGKIAGTKAGQRRIFSKSFEPINETVYEDICLNDNGLVFVKTNGKWSLLNSELEPVTDQQFEDVVKNSRGQAYESGSAVVADESGYFLLDEEGDARFETRFAQAKGIEGGWFAVSDNEGNWGFSDFNGNLVIEYQYSDAYSFSDRLAAVQYAGKWGYINQYGDIMIEPQFEEAWPFLTGKAMTKDDMGIYRILELKYYELF